MRDVTVVRVSPLSILAMFAVWAASGQPAPQQTKNVGGTSRAANPEPRGGGNRNGTQAPIGPDQALPFDYDGSGKQDHLVLYRPGAGAISILKHSRDGFTVVYHQTGLDGGIGTFDLKSRADHMFAIDYNRSGKLDHLVVYRPGTGAISIFKPGSGSFATLYRQDVPGEGIGGYDLKSRADRGLALDYGSTGKQDHIVFLRAGTGTLGVLKRTGEGFETAYRSPEAGRGTGSFDLGDKNDRGFAFDYDGSGKLDHLVVYRPGAGAVSILKRASQGFAEVYHQDDSASDFGGYTLGSIDDRAFAFDYDGSGKMDHLVFYRAGGGAIAILKRGAKGFQSVYRQSGPDGGIGGFDLKSTDDRAFAFDYDGSGKLDHLVLYRPGGGAISILKHSREGFSAVYRQGDNGAGIGGYDLKSSGH